MSLVVIKIDTLARRIAVFAVIVVCLAGVWFFAKWNYVSATSGRIDQIEIAEIMIGLAPDDPQPHFAAAVLYDKTFDAKDSLRALSEYEQVAALSPNHYQAWLELGKARERNGDTTGANLAERRALALAPNYADVQWAYGNLLLRTGKTDEAFEFMRKAAAAKPVFANSTVVIAMQLYDGDVTNARRSVGNSSIIDAAFASYLLAQKRFDDAVDLWSELAPDEKRTNAKDVGLAIANECLAAKKFRLAARIFDEIGSNQPVVPERVTDGGFEIGVKLKGAPAFEWQIPDSAEPQISLTTSQKRTGNNSLWLIFNTTRTADFREIKQTVVVVPAATYTFEAFYRSELRASMTVRWEIVDLADGKILAKTDPVLLNVDWAPLQAQFTVPTGTDGVIVRLVRDSCQSLLCPIAGKLWFDDISITRR